MSFFADTFREIRRRRRMSLREVAQRASIPTSTVHRIEIGELLPDRARTQQLAEAFSDVAAEQNAALPLEEALELVRARDVTAFMVEGLSQSKAEALVGLREHLEADAVDSDGLAGAVAVFGLLAKLDDEQLTDLVGPLLSGLHLGQYLAQDQRRGVGRNLGRLERLVRAMNASQRRSALARVAEAVDPVIDALATEAAQASGDSDVPVGDGGGDDRAAGAARKAAEDAAMADEAAADSLLQSA